MCSRFGRLDLRSEGLILLTDDGALANRLTHPRFEHPKTYYVLVAQRPSAEALARLREGGLNLRAAGLRLRASRLRTCYLRDWYLTRAIGISARFRKTVGKTHTPEEGVWLRIVLREGKKRQIRHMAAAVGIDLRRAHSLVDWPTDFGGPPSPVCQGS